MIASLISWWLATQILGIVALPLTALLFGHLPLKGYPFSKVLGLLGVGYGSWLLAMLGLAHFGAGGIVLAMVVALAGGLGALGYVGLRALLATLRARWWAVLAYEILFAAALLAALGLRWNGAVGAAILGTEKPMDLAFLSGILRSASFPPQDPWLAGYAINYYYLGYLMVAVLAALSGVSVGEAFNLGLATTFALTALMIAGLVVALVEGTRTRADRRPGLLGKGAAALLGVVFVLVLGNQSGAWQLLIGAPEVVALDGRQLASAAVQRLWGRATIEIEPPVRTPEDDFGLISQLTPGPDRPFNWWWPSRAVWDDVEVAPGAVERRYAITEFPFFSFYLGDLHPHVLALPFDLMILALAMATLGHPLPGPGAGGVRERLSLAIAALALGSLYVINSWDAPTYALLYGGALLLGYRRRSLGGEAPHTFWWTLWEVATVAFGAGLAVLPFLLTFQSFAGSGPAPEPWSRIPVVGSLAKMLLPARDHADLHEFLGIFGLFVLILLVYAAGAGSPRSDTEAPRSTLPGTAWVWPVGGLVVGTLIGMPLLALLPLAVVCAWGAWLSAGQPTRAFVLWATAVGAVAIFVADVVYLRDPFENRMNTIFKFYYQAWVIWGTVAAYGLWALTRGARRRPLLVGGGVSLVALLCLGALVYPLATLTQGQPWVTGEATLDGLAFFRESSPDEAAALAWIEANTRPDDVVLTAVGSSYDGSTGWVAAVTGRATLLGWSGSHERLWRRGSPEAMAEIGAREHDVPVIYKTTDAATARRLLKQYAVAYVYVGPTERHLYPGPGLDKFDAFLQPVFQQGDVHIYGRP